ncbi:MAG TPA: M20 family metallopeptidase [Rectinemataceae bacterium]
MDERGLLDYAESIRPWLSALRRRLHAIPEPGDAEHKTQAEICSVLDSLGIPYERRRTSVVGYIEGGAPGPLVGLRADMDALPVQEPEDRPYRSTHPGMMHACGHDAHMTCALGAARYFSERAAGLAGSVRLLFQPAEETDGGAAKMIADGYLENPRVDYVVGCHVMPYLPPGHVEIKKGALNGSSDKLEIRVFGKSGHAAYPETAIDAIMIASKVVDGIHSLVSRTVSPLSEAVITIGTIEGGTRNNIIADEVRMTGTIRTTDPAVRAELASSLRSVVQGISAAFGGSGEVNIVPGYAALINHDSVVELVAREAEALFGTHAVHWKEKPSLGVEDFSFFLMERPGAFYHLGCGLPGGSGALHSREFDIDEACLQAGVALHAAVILGLMEKKP